MPSTIKIGSRGSDLALWQANHVKRLIENLGHQVSIEIIKTQGDQIQNLSFDKLEGKGFFTKEIEEKLLDGSIDLAVHSHKDLETNPPKSLVIGAVSERENPAELLIIRKEAANIKERFSLKKNSIVGTSSARRKAQLWSFRKDVTINDLRGNVPTRINKLREKQYDAIILAAAGVERLEIDLSEFHVVELDPKKFIPPPAQGVLGLQAREHDDTVLSILQKINNQDVEEIIKIERKVLNLFDGGCQLPLGVYCLKENNTFKVWASLAKTVDHPIKRVYLESKSKLGLSEKIVELLQKKQSQNVFITRKIGKSDLFGQLLDNNGFSVFSDSLIRFEQVNFDPLISQKFDWIFFSSKNSVRFFFEQQPLLSEKVKFACIGAATRTELNQYSHQADFVGSGNNTHEIAELFKQVINTDTVLFPQSDISLRTIQQLLTDGQATNLNVYRTTEASDVELPKDLDIVIFTSPSNVRSYFHLQKEQKSLKYIAIGESTGKELKKLGINDYLLPWDSSLLALADTIMSL